jgi:hypothetical protein
MHTNDDEKCTKPLADAFLDTYPKDTPSVSCMRDWFTWGHRSRQK